jgi:hypothetical protein
MLGYLKSGLGYLKSGFRTSEEWLRISEELLRISDCISGSRFGYGWYSAIFKGTHAIFKGTHAINRYKPKPGTADVT